MTGAAPLVVIAIGNPSRGDDALGPLLIEQVGLWQATGQLPRPVELIEDFQLQVEHAMDICDRRAVLFVDAGARTPGPFTFTQLLPSADFGHTTHAISPQAVLHVCAASFGPPPPAFLLCVRGESFELGEALSPAAQDHLRAALAHVRHLLTAVDLADWASFSDGQPALPTASAS